MFRDIRIEERDRDTNERVGIKGKNLRVNLRENERGRKTQIEIMKKRT
jgi:hypothetical protein